MKIKSMIAFLLFLSCSPEMDRKALHFYPLIDRSVSFLENTFFYSPEAHSLEVGKYVEIKPIKQGIIQTCQSLVPLPLGLNLSSECEIFGTPQTFSPLQTYQIKARFENSEEKIASLALSVSSGSTLPTPPPPPPPPLPLIGFQYCFWWPSVSENAGTYSVPVILSQASNSIVTVNYQVSGGWLADLGVDYNVDYTGWHGTLTFNPGETYKEINVHILDDNIAEGSEYLYFSLFSPSNATLGCSSTGVNITDNEVVQVNLSTTSASVSESSGTQTYYYPVTLSMPSTVTITVTVQVLGSSTASWADYSYSNVTFNPGETTKNLEVTIYNDSLAEPTETLDLKLWYATNASIGPNHTLSITILDDDPPNVNYQETYLVLVKNQFYSQTPTVSGNLTNCTITPALPAGLSLTATDCSISGVPTALHSTTTHILTAYNGTYTQNKSISIRVVDDTSYTASGRKYYLSTQGQSCTQRCASLGGTATDDANTATDHIACNSALTSWGISTSSITGSGPSSEFPCRYWRAFNRRIYSSSGFVGSALTYSSLNYNLVCPCNN